MSDEFAISSARLLDPYQYISPSDGLKASGRPSKQRADNTYLLQCVCDGDKNDYCEAQDCIIPHIVMFYWKRRPKEASLIVIEEEGKDGSSSRRDCEVQLEHLKGLWSTM